MWATQQRALQFKMDLDPTGMPAQELKWTKKELTLDAPLYRFLEQLFPINHLIV